MKEKNTKPETTSPKATSSEILALMLSRLENLENKFNDIADRQKINSDEISIIQTQVHKTRKWYSDPAVITSILALFISLLSLIYPIIKDRERAISDRQTRIKWLTSRLTEISTQTAINPATFGNFASEANSLLTEAYNFSIEEPNSLEDAQYDILAGWCFSLGRMDILPEILDRGISLSNDPVALSSLKSWKAQYCMEVKRDFEESRRLRNEVIEIAKSDGNSELGRKSKIAAAYLAWASSELSVANLLIADSILLCAENEMDNKRNLAFSNTPLYNDVNHLRKIIDSLKILSVQKRVALPHR